MSISRTYKFFARSRLLRWLTKILGVLVLIELVSLLLLTVSHFVTGSPSLNKLYIPPVIWREFEINSVPPDEIYLNYHPIYGWLHEINTSGGCDGTDAYGYRHNGNPKRKIEKNDKLIFLIGGSTAYGLGQSCADKTIAAQLEILVQKQNPSIKVINGGVPGYFAANEFHKVANEILPFNPMLVISLTGINDSNRLAAVIPKFAGREQAYFLTPYHWQIYNHLKEVSKADLAYSFDMFLSAIRSQATFYGQWYVLTPFYHWTYTGWFMRGVYNYFTKKEHRQKPKEVKYGDILENEKLLNTIEEKENFSGWSPLFPSAAKENLNQQISQNMSLYIRYLKMTKNIIHGNLGRHLTVLQPMLPVGDRRRHSHEDFILNRINELWKYHGHDIFAFRNSFAAKARSRFENAGLDWVDMTDAFPNDIQCYVDRAHYHDRCAKILATKIFGVLIKRGYLE